MQATSIVSPEVFSEQHFERPGYRSFVQHFLRSLRSTGNLLSDESGFIWEEIQKAIRRLPIKYRQDIEIRITELKKKPSKRKVVKCVDRKCGTASSQSSELILSKLFESLTPDIFLVAPNQKSIEGSTSMEEILDSEYDELSRRFGSELPPIEGDSEKFDDLIRRAVRFSRTLVIYDKQIGRGNSLSLYRAGIIKVIDLWTANSHFKPESVSIFTCGESWEVERRASYEVEKAIERNRDAFERIKRELLAPLKDRYDDLNFSFEMKNDTPSDFHARYLETNTCVVLFERGFDICKKDEPELLKRIELKLSDATRSDLCRYRKLPSATGTDDCS